MTITNLLFRTGLTLAVASVLFVSAFFVPHATHAQTPAGFVLEAAGQYSDAQVRSAATTDYDVLVGQILDRANELTQFQATESRNSSARSFSQSDTAQSFDRETLIALIRELLAQILAQGNTPNADGGEQSVSRSGGGDELAVGAIVQATDRIRVRERAGMFGNAVGLVDRGQKGAVVGGPMDQGDYVWWRVKYDNGLEGWSAANWLRGGDVQTPLATVSVEPEAVRISPPSGVAPLKVTARANYVGRMGLWDIDFGDGSGWQTLTPCNAPSDTCIAAGETVHTYRTPGLYRVTVRSGNSEEIVSRVRVIAGSREGDLDHANVGDVGIKDDDSDGRPVFGDGIDVAVETEGRTVTLRYTNPNGCVWYTVNWGDGTTDTRGVNPELRRCTQALVDVTVSHTFSRPGRYTIVLTGNTKFSTTVAVGKVSADVESFGLDDVVSITAKRVDPMPKVMDDEYTLYTISLANGRSVEVRANIMYVARVRDGLAMVFADAGYQGDVDVLLERVEQTRSGQSEFDGTKSGSQESTWSGWGSKPRSQESTWSGWGSGDVRGAQVNMTTVLEELLERFSS